MIKGKQKLTVADQSSGIIQVDRQMTQRKKTPKATLNAMSDSDTSAHKKVKQVKESASTQAKTSTVLLDWIIKPLPDIQGVCVEGQKQGFEDFWHSTAIVEAVKPKLVVTATGSKYKLKGTINKLCAINNGFSKSVVNLFTKGFPKNWKQIIQDFYSEIEKSIFISENDYPPINKKSRKLKTVAQKSQVIITSPKLRDTKDRNDSILTPGGIVRRTISAHEMTITRSGRVSLPPLAEWAGQHYRKTSSSNEIEVTFLTEFADRTTSQTTMQFLNLPKNSLKMVCSNALSKSFQASRETKNSDNNKKFDNQNNVDRNCPAGTNKVKIDETENRLNEHADHGSIVAVNKPNTSLLTSQLMTNYIRVMLSPLDQARIANMRQGRHGQVINTSLENIEDKETHDGGQSDNNVENISNSRLNELPGNGLKTRARRREATVNGNSKPVLRNKSLTEGSNFSQKSKFFLSEEGVSVQTNGGSAAGNRTSKSHNNNNTNSYSPPVQQLRSHQSQNSVKNSQDVMQQSTTDDKKSEVRKRRRTNDDVLKSSKRRTVAVVHADSAHSMWTEEENSLLQRALKEINAAETNYWEKVSQFVKTRSEMECQQMYKQNLEEKANKTTKRKPRSKPQSKNKSEHKKGEPITGGKGTLKRKQEIRAFLDEQNDGYEDNLFDSSPFARRKIASSVFAVDFDKNDSEIFGSNHNCITPVAGTSSMSSPGTPLRAQFASVRKTPLPNTTLKDTPVSINRRKADQYIKNFIDKRKKAAKSVSQGDSSIMELSTFPVKSLFSPVNLPSIVIDSNNDVDDDDEASPYMYYWNDET